MESERKLTVGKWAVIRGEMFRRMTEQPSVSSENNYH